MKLQKIKIASVIIGVLVPICLVYISTNQFNNQAPKCSIKTITVDELLKSFIRNETIATQQYLNKVIQVRGKISSIGLLKDNQVEIALKGTRYKSILCTLNPEQLFGIINSIEINSEVLIEGKCIGFLNDVYLKKCTVFKSVKQNC
ncbi:hypothetical protein SanaruYs_33120 [Chryseotalea sanaruensis]|uniref:tRNA_anti-like n=1 Tax=Chryseotalea sanaruensis TaxID=2482724 RepID=A0A401UDU8_9BACT|nr:hypothetical protein [Chryseotalea sanaruensis]GCC53071.1 hypothetical protein SanaruYs_33120 [Chryseotalea sanaruensis]